MRKSAFTLIEMIIVITAVGILSVFGSNIYFNTYENYLMTSSINKIQNRTELALEQIKNRLQNRIKNSVIAYDYNGTAPGLDGYVPLSQAGIEYDVLEWVGYDYDSYLGGNSVTSPDWSGFVDIDNSVALGRVESPGSNFTNLAASISRLSDSRVNFNTTAAPNVIITFFDQPGGARDFGWQNAGTVNNEVHPVARFSNTQLSRAGGWSGQLIKEQYQLSWTAYALVPDKPNKGDLTLYYNYQPWNGETYRDAGVESSLLAENISAFRFRQDGTAMQVQLCLDDNNLTRNLTGREGFAFCKEITIF